VVPFIEFFVVPLGLISFLTFVISASAAVPLLSLDLFFIKMLIFAIGKLSGVPYTSLILPPLGLTSWSLFALSGIPVLLMKRLEWLRFALPFLIAAFLLSAAYPILNSRERGELRAYFLDAGETKSVALFMLPCGANVLIDGGYSNYDRNGYIDRTVVNRFLVNAGVRRIDYLILPSVDKDHIHGAMFFLDNFDVGRLLTNGDKLDSGLWERIRESGVEWKNLLESELIRLPDDVLLDVLKPLGTFTVKDSSLPFPLSLKLIYGDVSFLIFESVYGREADAALLKTYGNTLESTVLYYRDIHDGNITAAFLRAVSPEIAITDSAVSEINSGKGKPPLLSGLNHLYETAKDGALTLTTDGQDITVDRYDGEKNMHMQ
jgi:beta-lactamase superfamily II metal-dependent hydrolase